MPIGAVVNVKSDAAVSIWSAFKISDDKYRLRRIADEQFRRGPFDFNAHFGPLARNEVDIGFVSRRRVATQAIEIVAGISEVLGGMVASNLVIGAPICRS